MELDRKYWLSGHGRKAIDTIPGLIREGEVYHVIDYADNNRCLVICSDDQEHWIDRNHFSDDIVECRLFNYIKKVFGIASQAYVADNEPEHFELMTRMYNMIRLLQTNSVVKKYDRDEITFVFDSYYEADKKPHRRTMSWKNFELFVADRVMQDRHPIKAVN